MNEFYIEGSRLSAKCKFETVGVSNTDINNFNKQYKLSDAGFSLIRNSDNIKNNMNLEEYNKLKYKNWIETVNLQNMTIQCPKCNEKLQELPGETGNPPQIKVECPKCKYKGIKLV